MRGPIFLLFIRAILLMRRIKRPTGHQRSSIGPWAVGSFGITNTSFRLAVTANGWMVGSFLHPWALMPRYIRPTAGVPLSARNINTLMWCIWILLLVIASPSAVSDMLSYWLTMLHNTTGHLVCGISHWTPSSLPFGYFGLQRVPLQDVSTATVTTIFLVRQSVNTSLTTNQRSLQLQPNGSCQTV